jgi:hypothetical protein
MLLPQYLIIGVMLSIGFFPQFYLNVIGKILYVSGDMTVAYNSSFYTDYGLTIKNVTISPVCLAIFIGLVWAVRSLVIKRKIQNIGTTRGCGYVVPNSHMFIMSIIIISIINILK